MKDLLRSFTRIFINKIFGEPITHVPLQEKVVALTYDDGPNPPYTEKLLNIFDCFQVKVTFFVIGKNIEDHPETVRSIHNKGHELANHSYSHKNMKFESLFSILSEIKKNDFLFCQLGVSSTSYVRPPFGSTNLSFLLALHLLRKKNVLWSIDPRDYASSSVDNIVNDVVNSVKPGAIILLHDGWEGNKSLTVAATEKLIPELQKRGYRFKTVSELISLRS